MYSKLSLSVLLIFTLCTARAQSVSDVVSFEKFTKWLPKQFGEYALKETSSEGEAEYNEAVSYKANYINSSQEVFSLQLTGHDGYSSTKMQLRMDPNAGTEFQWNGRNAVLIKFESPKRSFTYAAVELKEIHASIVVIASPAKEMDDIKSFINSFDVKSLIKTEENSIEWPEQVPEQAQIKANILSSNLTNSTIDGYNKEFIVEIVKNDLLIKEMQRMTEIYGSDLSVMKIEKDLLLNCGSADTIEGLAKIRDGERIRFTYYIND